MSSPSEGSHRYDPAVGPGEREAKATAWARAYADGAGLSEAERQAFADHYAANALAVQCARLTDSLRSLGAAIRRELRLPR